MIVRLLMLSTVLSTVALSSTAQQTQVHVLKNASGSRLVVDGEDFMIKGMNWDYFPIGTNYTYNLWDQSDAFIISALEREMTMLREIGVNALRIYIGIPKRWIAYIYKEYGIYTMLNHPFGRYGVSLDGMWFAHTDYADPAIRELLLQEVDELVAEYKDTPGLLLYLLGNENNYGLFYESPEGENESENRQQSILDNRAMYKLFLLSKDSDEAQLESREGNLSIDEQAEARALSMYRLFDLAAKQIKGNDPAHPVAMCNGDLMFMEIIKEECGSVDIFGTNVYRGVSFGDTFERVQQELNKPILFTEVGADAFNAITQTEDQEAQAYYTLGNWKEIYANAAGIGGTQNAIGGFTFQFSDGWWKHDQYENLDVHDQTATWNSAGYYRDDRGGQNNMNEEWFGVCAKVQDDEPYRYQLQPRASYFILREVHGFSPYHPNATLVDLEEYFKDISLDQATKEATERADIMR